MYTIQPSATFLQRLSLSHLLSTHSALGARLISGGPDEKAADGAHRVKNYQHLYAWYKNWA